MRNSKRRRAIGCLIDRLFIFQLKKHHVIRFRTSIGFTDLNDQINIEKIICFLTAKECGLGKTYW